MKRLCVLEHTHLSANLKNKTVGGMKLYQLLKIVNCLLFVFFTLVSHLVVLMCYVRHQLCWFLWTFFTVSLCGVYFIGISVHSNNLFGSCSFSWIFGVVL